MGRELLVTFKCCWLLLLLLALGYYLGVFLLASKRHAVWVLDVWDKASWRTSNDQVLVNVYISWTTDDKPSTNSWKLSGSDQSRLLEIWNFSWTAAQPFKWFRLRLSRNESLLELLILVRYVRRQWTIGFKVSSLHLGLNWNSNSLSLTLDRTQVLKNVYNVSFHLQAMDCSMQA